MGSAADQLMATPLGQLLSASEATELVDASKTRSLARGTHLFRAGDKADALYVVLTGSFDVVLGQAGRAETVVAKLAAGQIAGELECMTKSLRVASLIATEEAEVLELAAEKFDAMGKDNRPSATKLLQTIAKTLARRLAAVNHQIVAKAPPAPMQTPTQAPEPKSTQDPVELDDTDVVPMDDEDLNVLDKLWS